MKRALRDGEIARQLSAQHDDALSASYRPTEPPAPPPQITTSPAPAPQAGPPLPSPDHLARLMAERARDDALAELALERKKTAQLTRELRDLEKLRLMIGKVTAQPSMLPPNPIPLSAPPPSGPPPKPDKALTARELANRMLKRKEYTGGDMCVAVAKASIDAKDKATKAAAAAATAPAKPAYKKSFRRLSPQALKAERNALGWSQTELGRKVGVHQTMISAWERGIARPDPVQQAKLNTLLDNAADTAKHNALFRR